VVHVCCLVAIAMKLRDHPLMSYRGVSNWPPVWCRTGRQTLTGEIGVLANADTDRSGSRCYISIDFENERYCGTLLFTDVAFCWFIAKMFKNRIGASIKEIGDLDLSYTL
jgi:hypothetical protein